MLSLRSDDRTPLSPKTRASNAASSATIVKTTLDRHASATEPAMFAPSDCKDSARARVRLKTVRRCPDRNRLFAIPVPILPSPISPISISDSSLSKELAAPPSTCSLFWHSRNRLNFDKEILTEKPLHFDRRAGWRICRVYEFIAHLAHGGQLRDIENIIVQLDHILELGAAGLQCRFQVLKSLLRLSPHIAFTQKFSRSIERHWSGDVDNPRGPHFHCLRISGRRR